MLSCFVFSRLHSRRPASLRHVTKNPSPQLLYFPHLQNRDARNSFRFCSYVNWRVSPALFSLSLSSHSPYTLPSYVSCKACICHSYAPFASRTVLRDENTGGVGVFFPFWNAPFASRTELRATPSLTSLPHDFLISSSLSRLDATLVVPPVSVANKRLTSRLNPLDATLTKNTGWGEHAWCLNDTSPLKNTVIRWCGGDGWLPVRKRGEITIDR